MRVTASGSNVARSSWILFRKLAVRVSGRGMEKRGSPCTVHATRDRKQSLRGKRDDGVNSFLQRSPLCRAINRRARQRVLRSNRFPGLFGRFSSDFICFSLCALQSSASLRTRRFSCRALAKRNCPKTSCVRRGGWRNTSASGHTSPLSFYDLFHHRFNANSTQRHQ